jgi:hypothetical protein
MRAGLIGPGELARYGPVDTLAGQAMALLRQQKSTWELLRKGYEGLSAVRTRRIVAGGRPFDIQFNPARLLSSSANIDPEAIRQRRCFLCNLPPEQKGLEFGEFLILCNPFPIFPVHFTVPHRSHVPQRIDGAFTVLLDLTRRFDGEIDLLYNGPRCGASAPDHLHFQAGDNGVLSIPGKSAGEKGARIFEGAGVSVTALDDGLRRWFQLDGDDGALIEEAFDAILKVLPADEGGEEPMINILAVYRGIWSVLVFPRKAHRPSFYGVEHGMVISPAAVDMGGLIIAPREKDFMDLDESHVRTLFNDVCLSPADFNRAAADLRRQLA